MKSLSTPFGLKSPFSLSASGAGDRVVFTAIPLLTGAVEVGNTLTVAFTATGVGVMTAQVQFLRDGAIVQSDTIPITSGVEATDTYISTASGTHLALIKVFHDGVSRLASSNTINVLTSEEFNVWTWNDGTPISWNNSAITLGLEGT